MAFFMKDYKFETLSTHAGYQPQKPDRCMQVPINMTTAYAFDDIDYARRLFALAEGGNIYTRLQNPTNDALEQRISALEGGVGALALSSGHAAIALTMLTLAGAGDEIVSARNIYGGAINLLGKNLGRLGIKVHFVDQSDPENFKKHTNDKTRAYFVETIGNPNSEVCDLAPIAKIAKEYGVPLVVDNTVATPYLIKPIEHGADIVIHSTTKFMCGNGSAMGGAVVDSGNFTWLGNPRFDEFNQPDSSYKGVIFAKALGNQAFIARLRTQTLRDFGSCQSPFNSWLTLNGLETLALRMEKHCQNALSVAKWLEKQPAVARVNYPGLENSEYNALAKKYFGGKGGSVFTFELSGGREAGASLCNSLELIKIVANLGDSRTIISHPATTTHSQLSDQQLNQSGIGPGTIRISVGIEEVSDIIADLEQAMAKV